MELDDGAVAAREISGKGFLNSERRDFFLILSSDWRGACVLVKYVKEIKEVKKEKEVARLEKAPWGGMA